MKGNSLYDKAGWLSKSKLTVSTIPCTPQLHSHPPGAA